MKKRTLVDIISTMFCKAESLRLEKDDEEEEEEGKTGFYLS